MHNGHSQWTICRRRSNSKPLVSRPTRPLAYNGIKAPARMIDRRKFVILLSSMPLIGKAMLAVCLKPDDKRRVPPGFEQCNICGEYNGTTDASNLSWNSGDPPTGEISVSCLCHGILCPRCGKNLIHRPISNSYYPDVNEVWHSPWFAGMIPCSDCRAKEM